MSDKTTTLELVRITAQYGGVTNLDTTDPITVGLRAWQSGDLDALEAILAPEVTLHWVEPGPWDCNGRDEVMRLLRERKAERGGRANYPVRIDRVDEHTVIVSSEAPIDPDGPQPFPVATRIDIADGKVRAMQQFRTGDQS
jgi:ketosteroid isomerase-like protein